VRGWEWSGGVEVVLCVCSDGVVFVMVRDSKIAQFFPLACLRILKVPASQLMV